YGAACAMRVHMVLLHYWRLVRPLGRVIRPYLTIEGMHVNELEAKSVDQRQPRLPVHAERRITGRFDNIRAHEVAAHNGCELDSLLFDRQMVVVLGTQLLSGLLI